MHTERKQVFAGIGSGFHNGAVLEIPKQEKPFIVVDGVVYINAKLIKENTL